MSLHLEMSKDIMLQAIKKTEMFFVMRQPYKAAKTDTIVRWMSRVITIKEQKGSPEAGSTTHAVGRGVFRRFYFKHGPLTFADGVLS